MLRVVILSDLGQPTNWVVSAGIVLALLLAAAARIPRWLAGAWLCSALLYIVAAGAENERLRQTLTGVWFTDWYRLGNILPFVGALLLAGLASMIVVRARGTRRTAIIAIWCVAGLVAAALSVPANRTQTALLTTSTVVTPSELAAARWVAEHSLPGERTLNQWNDGSPWGYAQYGTPVAAAYSSTLYTMPDRAYLIAHLGELGSNPRVNGTMLALRIRWMIFDPTKVGLPKPLQVPVDSPFVQVAFCSGETIVYRVDLDALATSVSG